MNDGWEGDSRIARACVSSVPRPIPAAGSCRSPGKRAVIKNRRRSNGPGNKNFKAHSEILAAPL